MNRQNFATYRMLTRVLDFILRNLSLFPKQSAAAEILKTLEAGVRKLTEAAATSKSEEAAIREASKSRATARKVLRDLISRASLVARALHVETIRLPRKESEAELIGIGRGFGNSVEAVKEDFVRHGLSPDDVTSAVEALESAILNQTTAKTARSAAFAEWNKAMAETMDALIGLDAIVANTLAGNPVALASYETLRRIPRTGGRAATAKTPAAVTPPETPPESPPASAAATNAA